MSKYINYANLTDEQVKKIKDLEKKLGACLLAYKVNEGPDIKNLTKDEISEIQDLENELGLSLVAYISNKGKGEAA